MAETIVLKPQSIATIQNFTPNDVTFLQDKPSAIDGNHLLPNQTVVGQRPKVGLVFNVPGTMVGTQTVNAAFTDANWVGLYLEVVENGVVKYTSPNAYTGYNNLVTSFPFEASVLSDPSGKNTILRVCSVLYNGLTIDYLSAVELVANYQLPDRELIDTLKTDWQPSDFYNYEDLNRVENATEVVRKKLEKFREMTIVLNIVNNRTEATIEFADSLTRIENNITELISIFDRLENELDTMRYEWTHNSSFDFRDAIRLERNLGIMFDYIYLNEANIPYCGQYICGQEGVI